MATKCILAGCDSVTSSPTQPEPGWTLLKLSALDAGGALVMQNYGALCPSCRPKLPELRSLQDQIVPPPAPELEPAAAASPTTEDAPTTPTAAAAPEAVEITAADVGAVPDALKAE